MHIVIEKKDIQEFFGEKVLDWIDQVVEDQIEIQKDKFSNTSSKRTGGMIYEDVLKSPDGLKNIWIEYEYTFLSDDVVLPHITRIIVYDEIPDIVLDRINELKEIADEIFMLSN